MITEVAAVIYLLMNSARNTSFPSIQRNYQEFDLNTKSAEEMGGQYIVPQFY